MVTAWCVQASDGGAIETHASKEKQYLHQQQKREASIFDWMKSVPRLIDSNDAELGHHIPPVVYGTTYYLLCDVYRTFNIFSGVREVYPQRAYEELQLYDELGRAPSESELDAVTPGILSKISKQCEQQRARQQQKELDDQSY